MAYAPTRRRAFAVTDRRIGGIKFFEVSMRFPVCLLLMSTAIAQDGASIYQKRCAACHNAGSGRAPRREVLSQMSPESIRSALSQGMMTAQGSALSTAEIRAVSTFLTGKQYGGEEMPKQAFCPG